MKHCLKLMSLFLIGFVLTAQGDADLKFDAEKTKLKHQYPSVKVNIAGLGNALNVGIGFSFDWPLSKHWSIEAELGPVFYSGYVKYKEERHYGIRTRGSLKYIINTTDEDDSYTYFKGMFKYNKAKSIRYLTTTSPGGNYSKELLVEGTLETFGPSLSLGVLQLFGENDRFFIDASGGFGLVFWDYPIELPAGFELVEPNSFLFDPNTSSTTIDLVLSFKIGMFLGKG